MEMLLEAVEAQDTASDNRLDQLAALEELAQDLGFDSYQDMMEYDRQVDEDYQAVYGG